MVHYRKYYVLICTLLLSAGNVRAQDEPLRQLQFDVAYLSSDLLEGRETGTKGEKLAAEYIASRFEDIGLQPVGGSWYQPFYFHFNSNPHPAPGEGEPRTGRNVIGMLDNGAEHTVVIGAHYDHLGHGYFGSLDTGERQIHNGADDNASGVAAMLAIAEKLSRADAASNNYLFVAFSGEELGLLGSKYFVAHPTVPAERMNYMINLDMVGRMGAERTVVANGTGTSPAWTAVLDAGEAAHGLKINRRESGLGPSDHTSFYLAGVPVLHFFAGQHGDYHKSSDDSHLINYEGIADIASLIVGLVEALDDRGRLAFTKTADRQASQTSFKVALGIMPDYVSTGEGLRIDAVLDGRPAARAGLQKGDIVVRLGEVEVKDVEDYMRALSQFEKGAATTVVVRRGEAILEKEVQF